MVWGNLATGYWLGGAAAAGLHWVELGRKTLTGISENIYVAGGWSEEDTSAVSVNTANSRIDITPKRDGTNNSVTYDLGTNLSGTWVMRFKLNFSQNSAALQNYLWFGVKSVDSSGALSGSPVNYDAFGGFVMNEQSTDAKERHGMTSATNANYATEHQAYDTNVEYATGTDYYCELIRTGTTTGTFTIRTGSHTGSVHNAYSYSGGENATNLRYLTFSDLPDVANSSGGMIATISDITVDDNATSYSSADYTVSFNKLTAKPYMMVLTHMIGDDSGNDFQGGLRFNGDSGNNYADRSSRDGASDSTATSTSRIIHGTIANDKSEFATSFITNKSDQEKLVITQNNFYSNSSTAPRRRETVGKWANTSDSITALNVYNMESGADFQSGSEVVVLGCDPDDTEGTNIWEELKSVSLSSGADTLDSGSFTSKKYLWIQAFIPEGAAHQGYIYFNNDTGANYSRRGSINGGSDISTDSDNEINWSHDTNSAKYLNMFVINKSDEDKLCIAEYTDYNSAGAGNAPNRIEWVYKWVNTSAQISSVKLYNNQASSNDFPSGTLLKVWGFD